MDGSFDYPFSDLYLILGGHALAPIEGSAEIAYSDDGSYWAIDYITVVTAKDGLQSRLRWRVPERHTDTNTLVERLAVVYASALEDACGPDIKRLVSERCQHHSERDPGPSQEQRL